MTLGEAECHDSDHVQPENWDHGGSNWPDITAGIYAWYPYRQSYLGDTLWPASGMLA